MYDLASVHGETGILKLLLTISCPILIFIVVCFSFKWIWSKQITTVGSVATISDDSIIIDPIILRKYQNEDIKAKVINNIFVDLFRGEFGGEDAECSICLGCLSDGEKVKILPSCKHVLFHSECTGTWLVTHRNCSLCRSLVVWNPEESV